jgi:membrane associated rhomboid family serine protease
MSGYYDSSYNTSGSLYWTPGVKLLIIANGVVFGLQILFDSLFQLGFTRYFALSPDKVIYSFWLWQLVTSAFLHDLLNPFHILFNLLTLYFFGFMVERHYGTRKFLGFYIACAIFASLVYTTVHFVTATRTLALGASGAIMGVLMLATCLNPNNTVYLQLLFPVRLRTMVWILIAINLYMAIVTPNNQIAATAHLGGLLFGYLYYRYSGWFYRYLQNLELHLEEKVQKEDYQQNKNLRAEVDRLLDKIAQEGLNALTPKEREFLQKASREYQRKIEL